ncbi:hypothetical protein [Paraherbaspirillum soli]|uniref:Uncharacterized protein n=1 Tax=Paraherbaspirillum soli TaxID=631222 RepID=A0ABW0MBX7_9BURK
MLWQWNEYVALIDAEHVALSAPPQTRQRKDADLQPPVRCRHEGNPAAALATLLQGVQPSLLAKRQRLQVLLGYPWASSVVLPWQPGLAGNDASWSGYAQGLLREQGFESPLRVRVERAGFGQARLAFAADAALLDGIAAQIVEAGWYLSGCRDLMSATLLRYRRQLMAADYTLTIVEPGAVTTLVRSEREWRDVATLVLADGQSASEALGATELLTQQAQQTPPANRYWSGTVDAAAVSMQADAIWLGSPLLQKEAA